MMFYKETIFKDTEIGRIPKDWEVVRVNKLFDLYKGTTPSTKIKEYWDGTIPFVTPTDITKINDLNEIYLKTTENYITEKGLKSKGLKLVPKRSLLFTSRATIGYLAINKVEVAINQGIISLIPKDANVDVTFFYYFFQKLSDLFENLAGGSTYKEISMSTFSNINVPLPSLSEQQRIAEILSTVDEAIQKTNEIIAKTKRLKKGLMQELLTKGIGHKEFKDTEIGRIPKDWEVVRLKDVVSEAKPGFACGKRDENGILQLRMDNIEPEGWINVEAGVKVPIPEDVENYILKPGDILFNNTNSIDLIGKTAIFRGEFSRCVYSNHLTRIRVDRSKAIPEWILYLLIRKWELGIFKMICHRHVHQAGINNEDLLRLKIPLPSLQEQQKITSIILTVDSKIKLEKMKKAKLERIKQGLMDLLLTGKIRVKVS
jgi:type I restriction enzyme S subunit